MRTDSISQDLDWAERIDCANSKVELTQIIDEINAHYKKKKIPSTVIYYLGNAYSKLSELTPRLLPNSEDVDFSWYQKTIHYRTLAKIHFTDAFNCGLNDKILMTRAITNRTNHLFSGYRWIEALNDYFIALDSEPHNGVASSGIVKIALRKRRLGALSPDIVRILVTKYYPLFLNSIEFTESITGSQDLNTIIEDLNQFGAYTVKEKDYPILKPTLSKYEQFCFDNKLYLPPYLPREFFDLKKSEDFQLKQYYQGKSKVDEESAKQFFNEIKNCFGVARYNAFQHFNTDKGNTYFLISAQKLAFDILDKIAVAIYSILSPKHSNIASVYFYKVWFETKDINECDHCGSSEKISDFKVLKGLFVNEIAKGKHGNPGLIALIELAYDIFFYERNSSIKYAYLSEMKKMRNASTHKFLTDTPNNLKAFTVKSTADIEREVLDTLFMVKSAINYFVEFVYWRNTYLHDEIES